MSAEQTDLFDTLDQKSAADGSAKQDRQDLTPAAPDDKADEFAPLAARLRPRTLDEYVGQEHILGLGKPLRIALDRGECYSMILWGPPGSGKTTLALLFARRCNAVLEQIPAVTSGIKDIRDAVARAKDRRERGVRTLLFVDEVHRFNRSQQDAFLPHIEDGTLIFIGATTENPSFNVNKALLSRARVYVLKALSHEDLLKLINLALTSDRGLGKRNIELAPRVADSLADLACGDARLLLNMLEMCSDLAAPLKNGKYLVTMSMLGAVAGRRNIAYDKGGDVFYDLISAFHKSVRGSAPDAALYWYSRILEAGGDPLYVARRLLAIATEDVGLADPRAMQIALNAWDIYERVGSAEGERAIAEATVYLALAPKSNHLYTAFHRAREDAREHGTQEVPLYLRNAPTRLMDDLGYHKGYRYAHDFEGAYAPGECFFPEDLAGTVYYTPSERGFEIKLKEKEKYLKERDALSEDPRYPKGFKGSKTTHNGGEDAY